MSSLRSSIVNLYFFPFPVDKSIIYGARQLDSWDIGTALSVPAPSDYKANRLLKSGCQNTVRVLNMKRLTQRIYILFIYLLRTSWHRE